MPVTCRGGRLTAIATHFLKKTYILLCWRAKVLLQCDSSLTDRRASKSVFNKINNNYENIWPKWL